MMKDFFKTETSGPLTWLGLAGRVALGLILVASGTIKAAAPAEEFALVIESYQLVPSPDLILVMSTFLPWLELFAGFGLIFGYMTRIAAAVSAGMLLAFISALLSIKLREIELPNCGCFGFGWHPSPTQTLVMDVGLSGCAYLAFRGGAALFSLDNWCRSGYN